MRLRFARVRRLFALADSPAVMALGRFGAMFVALISAPIVARALGPEGRGVTAAALSILVLTPILLGMGVPLAARRRISAGQSIADAVRTGRVFAVLTLLPAVLIGIPFGHAVLPALGASERLAFTISMALVPLSVSWSIDANVLVVAGRYRRVAILSVLQACTSTSAILLTWLFGELDVSSVLYAFLAGNIVAFAFGLGWVRGRGGHVTEFRSLVGEAGSLAGGQVSDVASKRLDQIIALPLMGAHGAGLYSIAALMASIATPVIESLGNHAFRDLTTADFDRTIQTLRQAGALSLLMAAGLAPVSWALVPIAFGEAFIGARAAVLIAVGGSCLGGIGFMCSMALAAQRRGGRMTMAQVAGLVFGIGTMAPASLAFGPVGAACAMAGGSLVVALVSLQQLGIRPAVVLPRPRDYPDSIRRLFGWAE